MRNLIQAAAALALFIGAATAAMAHAHLDHASPAVGSTVSPAPSEVVLWFSEMLEPAFSSVEVRDGNGAAVQAGKPRVDPRQRTQMRVPLKHLAPGTYKVLWRVLSVDTHRSQGNFSFTVGR
ncbi:MAG TPA: copper homeostasis periplasmic binding protein CopC [Pseudolabrys sp.]|nr:copper homeostasis periplasmic binding protein CopC [Pseudolabrys sp.]